jgi:hypothetical protein
MKEYLQLEGMVYKLVPIRTILTKDASPMGQIDADKMYAKVMKWDWGSESPNIYHDPETRKNSVNYRSYLKANEPIDIRR